MKVLLINPSGGYPHEYPPLGLLYIAAALRESGHEVGFFDEGARCKTNISLMEYARQFGPDICGIAVYTTNVLETFKKISQLKTCLPLCATVVGGPHATVLPERTLLECKDIDFLVCGEGEITVKELLEAIEGQHTIANVNGLYYRSGQEILHTPQRDLIKDLDSIPFPMYELLENFEYSFDVLRVGKKIATLMTSRGCPYDCAFCAAKAVWRGSFRRRSPENVSKEISWLLDSYKYDELYFMDDLFAVNKKWLDDFYALLQKNNIDVPWKCLGRVDLLSLPDYKKMAENGCYVIQFGVESGDNVILKDINKNITTFQVKKAFNEARSAGLNTYGFFIVGHRLDTYQTILKTINFAKSLNPDFVSFFALVPFPGTKLYDLVPAEHRYEWGRIMYSGWGRGIPPIKLSSIEPKDLLTFEWQSHVKVYASLSYLLKNIILSRSRRKPFMHKCKLFILHLASRFFNVLKGTWIFTRFKKMDLTDYVENDAFMSIWREWQKRGDLDSEVKWHVEERKNFFDMLTKYIGHSDARSVLEIGCGTAIDSHYLSGKFNNVAFWACDVSKEAVEVAKKTGELLASKVNLTVADVESMQFDSGSFDIVFSQGVMEHFKDPIPGLKEQLRVLKSGGYLIIDVPQKYNPYTIYKHRRLKEGIWEYGWEKEYSFRELKEIGRTFDIEVIDVGSYGYGYFQDYGFSLIPFILRQLKQKTSFLSSISRFCSFLLTSIEKKYGHYFMQNITVVYKKK